MVIDYNTLVSLPVFISFSMVMLDILPSMKRSDFVFMNHVYIVSD